MRSCRPPLCKEAGIVHLVLVLAPVCSEIEAPPFRKCLGSRCWFPGEVICCVPIQINEWNGCLTSSRLRHFFYAYVQYCTQFLGMRDRDNKKKWELVLAILSLQVTMASTGPMRRDPPSYTCRWFVGKTLNGFFLVSLESRGCIEKLKSCSLFHRCKALTVFKGSLVSGGPTKSGRWYYLEEEL